MKSPAASADGSVPHCVCQTALAPLQHFEKEIYFYLCAHVLVCMSGNEYAYALEGQKRMFSPLALQLPGCWEPHVGPLEE